MLRNKVMSIVAAAGVLGLACTTPADARSSGGRHVGGVQRAFHNPGLGALNFGLGSPVFGNCGRNVPYFDYDPCACYGPGRLW